VREHLHADEPVSSSTDSALMQRLFDEGKIARMPTRRHLSERDLAEREALGRSSAKDRQCPR